MIDVFTIVADNSMAGIGQVASLVTMTTCADLTCMAKVYKDFTKMHVAGDRLFDSNTVMTDSVLNVFPTRVGKETSALMNYIAIVG